MNKKKTPIKQQPEKKKPKKRTVFTIAAMVNIIWYTIVVLLANFFDHTVQSELTVAWFSAWTVELALLFGIKVKSSSSGLIDTASEFIDDESDVEEESTSIDDENAVG